MFRRCQVLGRGGRESGRTDDGNSGEALEMRVRGDELSPGGERGGIDHCVGHGEVAIQADPSRKQGQALIEGHHARPQRCGKKSVGGGGTLRGEQLLVDLVEHNGGDEQAVLVLKIRRKLFRARSVPQKLHPAGRIHQKKFRAFLHGHGRFLSIGGCAPAREG